MLQQTAPLCFSSMSYALIDGSTVFVDILTNEDDAILLGTILENEAASSYLLDNNTCT